MEMALVLKIAGFGLQYVLNEIALKFFWSHSSVLPIGVTSQWSFATRDVIQIWDKCLAWIFLNQCSLTEVTHRKSHTGKHSGL